MSALRSATRLPGRVLLPLGLGLLGLVLLLLTAAAGTSSVMPSYLAAWLFWLSIPVGALASIMTLELAGHGRGPGATALRPLLLLLPLAALFVLPVLFRLAPLYGWVGQPMQGLAGAWFTRGFFITRTIIYLLAWSLLSLAFLSPPRDRNRQGLAGFGLLIHLVIGTLAATDWAMSFAPGLASSLFGLIVIAAQCSLAVAVALMLGAGSFDQRSRRRFAWLMVATLAGSAYLQFVQYLIVWSADLPREIVWYQQRVSGFGAVALWFGVAALVLATVLILPRQLSATAGLLATLAGMVVAVNLIEMLWLITPSFAGRFVLGLPDLLALVGIGGLMTALFVARNRPVLDGSVRDGI